MSTKNKALAEGGTPTRVTRFDGVRVLATEYQPVWRRNTATDTNRQRRST